MATISSRATTAGHAVAVWRVPRTRGALNGVLLVLLGVWGGLVPFIGPRFGFAYTPSATWTMTWGRLWLETVPAAATVLGGLILVGSANRVAGLWAAWLAALGGAWFVVGPSVSQVFFSGRSQAGSPLPGGSAVHTMLEELAVFYGLGAVIVFLAAVALGRFSVIGVREHEAVVAEREAASVPADNDPAHADDTQVLPTGRNTADEAERARLAQEHTTRIQAENAAANRRGPNRGDTE